MWRRWCDFQIFFRSRLPCAVLLLSRFFFRFGRGFTGVVDASAFASKRFERDDDEVGGRGVEVLDGLRREGRSSRRVPPPELNEVAVTVFEVDGLVAKLCNPV